MSTRYYRLLGPLILGGLGLGVGYYNSTQDGVVVVVGVLDPWFTANRALQGQLSVGLLVVGALLWVLAEWAWWRVQSIQRATTPEAAPLAVGAASEASRLRLQDPASRL